MVMNKIRIVVFYLKPVVFDYECLPLLKMRQLEFIYNKKWIKLLMLNLPLSYEFNYF